MKKSALVITALVFAVAVSLAFTNRTGNTDWKNLKILPQNTTEQQMDSIMNHYSVSLNVGCDFCHVKTMNGTNEEWDMASDKKKHKLKAREMMTLTNDINNRYFPYAGKAEELTTKLNVTCYTCHNGQPEPEVKPKPKSLVLFPEVKKN